MGGTVHAHGRRRWARLIVLMLAVVGALVVTAPTALAFDPIDVVCDNGNNTMHGETGSVPMTCYSCHGVDAPVEPIDPVDTTKCLMCHLGGYKNRPVESDFGTCWSCHYPGENQDDVQTSDGCAAEGICHVVDAATNLPHYGANTKGCVDGCHRTASQSYPNGSAHHDDGLPSCFDCHDGGKALEKVHEPFTAPLDVVSGGPFCYSCHLGYDVTHPDPDTIVERTLSLSALALTVKYGGTTVLTGGLVDGTTPVSGALITLLGRPVLTLDWIKLQTATTNTYGKFTSDPVTPVKNTTYGAFTKGKIDGDRVLKPVLGTVLVKVAPTVTTTLTPTSFLLGKSVYVSGKVKPAKTGGKVKWRFQRYVDGVWKTVTTTGTVLLDDFYDGTYSWATRKYTPTKKGTWRVRTEFIATTEYAASNSAYVKFVVK